MNAKVWFALPLALLIAAIVILAPRPTATPSPVHAVNVYLDGIIHADFRQACSVITAPTAFPKMAACEAYFTQSSAYYGTTVYRVTPHSERVWKQPYRGRTLTLAVVRFGGHGRAFVAHLRLTARGWLLTSVAPA